MLKIFQYETQPFKSRHNYKFHFYRAIKSVKAGGNVFNCYGPHFRRHTLTERQETLKAQYHFVCDCVSCKRKELVEFQERFSGKLNFGVLGRRYKNNQMFQTKQIF